MSGVVLVMTWDLPKREVRSSEKSRCFSWARSTMMPWCRGSRSAPGTGSIITGSGVMVLRSSSTGTAPSPLHAGHCMVWRQDVAQGDEYACEAGAWKNAHPAVCAAWHPVRSPPPPALPESCRGPNVTVPGPVHRQASWMNVPKGISTPILGAGKYFFPGRCLVFILVLVPGPAEGVVHPGLGLFAFLRSTFSPVLLFHDGSVIVAHSEVCALSGSQVLAGFLAGYAVQCGWQSVNWGEATNLYSSLPLEQQVCQKDA